MFRFRFLVNTNRPERLGYCFFLLLMLFDSTLLVATCIIPSRDETMRSRLATTDRLHHGRAGPQQPGLGFGDALVRRSGLFASRPAEKRPKVTDRVSLHEEMFSDFRKLLQCECNRCSRCSRCSGGRCKRGNVAGDKQSVKGKSCSRGC